jgi:AcrR family transcriptional regulator
VQAGGEARRGRPPKVTEESIAEAVLAEGFAGLTVPAVAARLGVSTMTLYRHVPTRAHLLALAWDHVLYTHIWPGRGMPWRQLLATHAMTLWDLLAEHPGVVAEMSTAVFPHRMVGLFDDLAVALVGQGFPARQAMLAVDTVIDLTLDHRRGVETLTQSVEGTDGSLREQIGALWEPDAVQAADPEDGEASARRAVRDAMREAIADEPRVWFGHKLDLVLDGIAAGHQPTTETAKDASA